MGELPGRLPRIALTLLDGLDSLFSLIWLLICVLVVVVLAYLFTRYVAGRGGGMAGLLCAYWLDRAGVDYLLVEAGRSGSRCSPACPWGGSRGLCW